MKLHFLMMRSLPILIIIAVSVSSFVWAQPSNQVDQKYYFDRPPFINPRIIQELNTWLSDGGDQIISINLNNSQNSNRFFNKNDPEIGSHDDSKNAFPWVSINYENERKGFGYRYIGKTESGVHLLHIYDWPGGSGRFNTVMLITMETDLGGVFDLENSTFKTTRPRLLLKKLGGIALGDRWSGELSVDGNNLVIGKDTGITSGTDRGGWFSENPRVTVVKIDID